MYRTPQVKTVTVEEVLAKLGPARALMYTPGGGGGSDEGCDDE